MDDRNHQLIKSTERHEALFGIVEAIVFVGIGGTVKDSRRVDEVEAVLFDISLRFASLHVNRMRSLYIRNAYASRSLAAA